MNIFRRAAGFPRPRLCKQILVSLLSLALLLANWPQNLSACQDSQAAAQSAQAPPYAQQTPEESKRW